MQRKTLVPGVGFAALGIVMLLGAGFLWDTLATMDHQSAAREEAVRPAEIELTLIVPVACDQCFDGTRVLESIQKQSVRILKSETVSADSEAGATLIQTYGVAHVPAVLVRGEYDKENIREGLAAMGGRKKDNALVIETPPVYVDMASSQVMGLVDVTYLTDSSCSACYDPSQHKQILQSNFGLVVQVERTVDAQSAAGRALIKQYALTETPAVLLSSQALAYPIFAGAWPQVGTVESDGTLVFRRNAALGAVTYKDLKTGTIVRPKISAQ